MKVKEAIDYCTKQKTCNNCRFNKKDWDLNKDETWCMLDKYIKNLTMELNRKAVK